MLMGIRKPEKKKPTEFRAGEMVHRVEAFPAKDW